MFVVFLLSVYAGYFWQVFKPSRVGRNSFSLKLVRIKEYIWNKPTIRNDCSSSLSTINLFTWLTLWETLLYKKHATNQLNTIKILRFHYPLWTYSHCWLYKKHTTNQLNTIRVERLSVSNQYNLLWYDPTSSAHLERPPSTVSASHWGWRWWSKSPWCRCLSSRLFGAIEKPWLVKKIEKSLKISLLPVLLSRTEI